MKAAVFSAALASLASSAAAQFFSLEAVAGGHPFGGLQFAANDEKIWLGKPTASFCPKGQANCPKGTSTNFALTGGDCK
jgi:hypothetical protein